MSEQSIEELVNEVQRTEFETLKELRLTSQALTRAVDLKPRNSPASLIAEATRKATGEVSQNTSTLVEQAKENKNAVDGKPYPGCPTVFGI